MVRRVRLRQRPLAGWTQHLSGAARPRSAPQQHHGRCRAPQPPFQPPHRPALLQHGRRQQIPVRRHPAVQRTADGAEPQQWRRSQRRSQRKAQHAASKGKCGVGIAQLWKSGPLTCMDVWLACWASPQHPRAKRQPQGADARPPPPVQSPIAPTSASILLFMAMMLPQGSSDHGERTVLALQKPNSWRQGGPCACRVPRKSP